MPGHCNQFEIPLDNIFPNLFHSEAIVLHQALLAVLFAE